MFQRTNVLNPAPTAVAVMEAPAAPATAGGKRRVSFGKAKANAKSESKTEYPVFDDPAVNGQILEIARRIKQRSVQIDSLKAADEVDKAELKLFTLPFYFKVNHGKTEVPSSVAIRYPAVMDGDAEVFPAGEVLVTCVNRYPKLEDINLVQPVLGALTDSYFRQSFDITVLGDELPRDKEQAIVDDILAVLEKHGVNMEKGVKITDVMKPIPDFHTARHSRLTPEQNLALDRVWPMGTQVKTKGRGKTDQAD